MAKEVITTTKVTDDLDGSEGAETLYFGYKGKSYEIDLSAKNAEKYDKTFQTLIAAARRTGAAPAKSGKVERDFDLVAFREWAGKKKIDIPQRGRMPRALVEQYKAEGGK